MTSQTPSIQNKVAAKWAARYPQPVIEFDIEDRRVVAIRTEGQKFSMQDADLLRALGGDDKWIRRAHYVQRGLDHAPLLSADEVVAIGDLGVWEQAQSCTAAEAPMKARCSAVPVREAAARCVAAHGTDVDTAVLLARSSFGVVRFHLAGGPDLPVEAATILADDDDLLVLQRLMLCHEDPVIQEQVAATLAAWTGPSSQSRWPTPSDYDPRTGERRSTPPGGRSLPSSGKSRITLLAPSSFLP
jgi:hypothetical protein